MLSEDWNDDSLRVDALTIESSGRAGFDALGAITGTAATAIFGPVFGPIVAAGVNPVLDQLKAVETTLTVAANTPGANT